MTLNLLICLLAALVPLVLGFLWYSPKVFGNAWMKEAGITEESMKGANMALIFGLTFVFSFLASIAITFMVIHQNHLYSILMNEAGFEQAGSEVQAMIDGFMAKYGSNFRTFKHGFAHGILSGLFLVFPLIGVNALFERKSFKYIAINAGFWTLCLAFMGGIICAFS